MIEQVEVYLLGLANVDHNVDEHAGVDEQKNKDWKVKPEKFAHTTIKVTATDGKTKIITILLIISLVSRLILLSPGA